MKYSVTNFDVDEWKLNKLGTLEKTFNAHGCTISLQASPAGKPDTDAGYHKHPEEQVVYLLEGEIEILLPGENVNMKPGCIFAIPPNVPHGARRIGEAALLMLNVFTPRRPDNFSHDQLQIVDSLED